MADGGSVSIALCGSGGAGVMTAANMLIDAAASAGCYALFGRSSGPQIRGGEAAAMVRLSPEPVSSVDDVTEILLAIDWLNVQRFAAELPLDTSSLIITDPAEGEVPAAMAGSGARIAQLPMKDLAKAIPGGRPNMIALGAVAALIGLDVEAIVETLGKSLKKKHADAFAASVAAVRAGAEAAAGLGPAKRLGALPANPAPRWAVTGNQAAGLGAVRGGIRFVAAYPITPATEILEWLTGALPKLGGVFVQAEDELASIAMCVGASFGGAPSLTATSGPGLALMIEALGMATASETPVVVVDVQRGGPSTGIPTKSEQSDLNIAVYGLHGDAPHLVVAPQSIGDCLLATQWAVHLAETLQAPCIVLSDQSLGQSRAVIEAPADVAFAGRRLVAETPAEGVAYKRYALTGTGVSPMAIPGTPGCQYTADGLEHTETGTPSSQAGDHAAQLDKRRRKLADHDFGDHWATLEGDGDIAVLTWGSCTGAAREAIARAAADGVNARLIAPRLLAPTRPEHMAAALSGVSKVLVVELSHQGQFHRYLRAEYDLPGEVHALHRAGPLPIRPHEIHARLLAMGT
ncbi:2-oxoacid:acceptor oxidoreductase subunit alpha [Magnetospirillum sp. UT-4]|uniref:2-oxoacid:acceptor oxidoreductase subunit alpha n=1 Tax=Magnetospirillum sp. UT-4 TaxID=2681467 RepID=UPI0013827C8E|nr:2-oxoacid:acceptor oxidoreductase subunit alpha [Magnetospirillum sp. UT-4]CAA7613617.1 2-oxoacid--ferredoxin oxidoreductasealpha subunit [Magnetospirillum sp. UT-4]